MKKKLNIRPLYDRILVRRMNEDEKTPGGLIIPDTAKEKPLRGEVIAIGKGKVNDDGTIIPISVNVGDKILFSKYAGMEFDLNGEELMMMTEADVFGVIS